MTLNGGPPPGPIPASTFDESLISSLANALFREGAVTGPPVTAPGTDGLGPAMPHAPSFEAPATPVVATPAAAGPGRPVAPAPAMPGAPGLPGPDVPGLAIAQTPGLATHYGMDQPSVSPPPAMDEPDYYFLRLVESQGPPSSSHALGVEGAREDFPALRQQVHGKPLVWLDNAATTQKPQTVIDAVSQYYENDNSNVHRGAHALAARATNAYEGAREKVQHFVNAPSPQEIVFVRGTTEAINLVAQTFGRQQVGPGDEIVLTTLEHHSNIVPWQMLREATGAVLRVVPIDDQGNVIVEEYARMLGPRVKIVALSHVSNALGTVLPVAEMTEMAHRAGAAVVVDGAQAVPHLPVDVADLGCDFYAFSGHKLFGPTGVGVLFGKQDLLESMPPWQGGGSMIRTVTFDRTSYNDPPYKFEAGTPVIAGAVGLGAAIDYVERLGMASVARHEQNLLRYATEALATVPGLRQIGTSPGKVAVLSFVVDWMRADELGSFLDREGIAVRAGHHCAQPTMQRFGLDATVRPSLALYNNTDDVDALVHAILKARRGDSQTSAPAAVASAPGLGARW
ncbi:MAG TPA: SufS family cysteine desulfurase [Actinomycetota bacterium]